MGMGSRNISISADAYARLRRARRHPRESFSQVIRRGRWDSELPTAESWLVNMGDVPPVEEGVLEDLEHDQQSDQLPEDKWTS